MPANPTAEKLLNIAIDIDGLCEQLADITCDITSPRITEIIDMLRDAEEGCNLLRDNLKAADEVRL